MAPSAAGIHLEASGSFHNSDPFYFPSTADKQAVPISALALATAFLKREIAEEDIDGLLLTGDYLFTRLNVGQNRAAEPKDLPNRITVNDPITEVEVTEVSNLTSYVYPHNDAEFVAARQFIHRQLANIFKTSPPDSGFLFNTPRGTVAFWESNGDFLVFDPQGVSESGLEDKDSDANNCSRLFRCESLATLSNFLLLHPIPEKDEAQFCTIVRMRFRLPLSEARKRSEQCAPSTSSADPAPVSSDSDTPLANRRPAKRPRKQRGKMLNQNIALDLGSDSDVPLAERLSAVGIHDRVPPLRPEINDNGSSLQLGSSESDSDTPLVARLPAKRLKKEQSSRPATPASSDSDSDVPVIVKNKGGRPKKKQRGRPKSSTLTDKERRKQTQQKYYEKHREKILEARRRTALENKDQQREQHRDAQQRYVENHPEREQEQHRDRQQRYVENHPERRQQQQGNYRASNPPARKLSHLSAQMRRDIATHGPMAFWSGDQLNNIEPHRLKKANLYAANIFKCSYCGARLFEEEPHTGLWCCGKGAYNVQRLPPLNADFYEHPAFLDRARAYNDMNALCAMGVTGGYRHPSGLSFFKIEGRIYHKIYNLDHQGQSFRYNNLDRYINHCRLYIDDGQERQALAEGRGLNQVIVDAATSFLLANNPLVRSFRRLNDEPAVDACLQFEVTSRATHGPVLGDPNPGHEVHAVLSTSETLNGGPRKLTVWKQGSVYPTKISVFDPLMEPFQYTLLYPHGTPGWYMNMRDNRGNKLSQLDYTRCLLLSEPRFSELGRLSQAWQVEMFARFEEERLGYIARCQTRNNPNAMRVAPLDELQAHVDPPPRQVQQDIANDVAQDMAQDEMIQGDGGAPAGKIYLPSSFTGGPRYMKKKYMNAMALCARKGGPTYFLTFTACGQWDELKQSTRHGNKCDPSTCDRIFHIKLAELLRDIRSGALFGPQAYVIYVIEMQKRGLPHAHLAIRVEDGGPTQGRDIDKVIRADLPGPEEAGGRLRELVLKHMLHGPCGRGPGQRTNLPCWDEKTLKCNKFFPKPHTETTHVDERGFVNYKRDTNNKAFTMYRNRQVEIHDGWIVPYNPFLLLKYEAHINLEIASTRRVIKYLFKYLHKGTSQSNVRVVPLDEQMNEPEEYVTKRMIGASDACWRLLKFDMTVSTPTVSMLPVHLEGEQSVTFRPGHEAQAVANASSDLLLYMDRPAGAEFDNLTYQKFHENYIVHTKRPNRAPGKPVYDHPDGKHFLTPRERGECVTRLFWVSPKCGELYYLRVLLGTIPCRGYKDLLARGGEGCSTFQETARRLGMVDNEKEYEETLREAASFMTGSKLRHFFCVLANIGAPAALLWNTFKDTLSEDFLERHPDDPEKAYKLSLIHIDRCLRRNGTSLAAQGLPILQDDSTELGRQSLAYSEEAQRQMVEEWEPRLTVEQRSLLDHIKMLVEGDAPPDTAKTLFLDGPGGYGKTQLLKVITSYIRSKGKVALCVASSGIAALNMEGGTTAHSMFKLPLDLGEGVGTWNISNGTQRAQLVRAAQLIIFDEAPMMHRHAFEMLDRSLKDLMGNDLPFGGKILLGAGDFRQCAPVVTKARCPEDVTSVSFRASHLWEQFRVFKLSVPQRTRGSDEYSDFLLQVGNGTLPETTFGEGREKEKLVPLVNMQYKTRLEELINEIYPANILTDPDAAAERAILATLNINAQHINDIILDSLRGKLHELLSFDEVDKDGDDGFDVDEDTLHQARAKGVPDHILRLKIGAVCLITRNLNVDQGLVNGTKVVVEAVSPRIVRVRKAGGNETFAIPRIIFQFPIVDGSPLIVNRRQFPLKLGYALSFHKSQGQTINKVGVDLRTDCFTHGQLYVGLSRVRSPDDIFVLVPEDRIHDGVPYTKNIIYHDLLQ